MIILFATIIACWAVIGACFWVYESRIERRAMETLAAYEPIITWSPYQRHRDAWERTGDLIELWAMIDEVKL